MAQLLNGMLRTPRRRVYAALGILLLLIVVILLVLLRPAPQLSGKFVYIELPTPGSPNDGVLRLRTIPGDSVQVIAQLDAAIHQPHWSLDGKRIVFNKITPFINGRVGGDIYVVNVDGSGLKQLTDHRHPSALAWSPDGKQIAFVDGIDKGSAIFTVDTDSATVKQLTQYETRDLDPQWSPDSTRIAFTTNRDGFQEIYTMLRDGTDLKRLTHTDNLNDLQPAWSPDGKRIAYITQYSVGDGTAELHIMNADGSNSRQLTDNEQGESGPSWSPDNIHIAYNSGSNTLVNIFIMNVDTGETKQLTNAVDRRSIVGAQWLPDGRHLLHRRNADNARTLYCIMDIEGTLVSVFADGCIEGMYAIDWWGQ
jgi:Tol biopolymer transport system component